MQCKAAIMLDRGTTVFCAYERGHEGFHFAQGVDEDLGRYEVSWRTGVIFDGGWES